MADVTGPISTLAGTTRDVPDGMMCDNHPDQPAVVRVQGETDSFGCEMEDICQQCVDERKAYRCSEAGQAEELEWRTGACEWCRNHVTDLRDARDYDEGMNGRVYRVCGACIKRVNDEAQAELDAMGYYDEPEEECWDCGGDGYVFDCLDGCCADADAGCDLCTRRCEVCRGKGVL